MRHFPIFMELHGRRALVLGSGEMAERKAEPLRRAGADVTIAPNFRPELLAGCAIAIGADAPEQDLRALSVAAQRAGIPVNVVDKPSLCSFITPAIVERDPITIAISSAGTAPVLARLLRAKIEAVVPPAFGRLAALADRLKDRIRARFPDLAARRRMLQAAFEGDVADLVFAGREAEAERAFADAIDGAETHLNGGIVHLVGGGPGAPDLLTLRAHRLLGEADVIVYDRLVGEDVLDMARRDAERIFVGKSRANHCLPQPDINALLVRLAREGRKVVRLKGGDPLVFGRGGEEAEALAAAGVRFDIVPGVTAALACAAGAGIPLTHREAARTVTFATGHTKEGRLDLDFAALVAGKTTIVIYMGVVTLPKLRDGLFAHGLARQTPAALIERGGTRRQRTLFGTLDELVAQGPGWANGGPALVVVGPVVERATLRHVERGASASRPADVSEAVAAD